MVEDDDLKFSMDDIIDMVSELFGEKVEKIDAAKAKGILKQETENLFLSGIELPEVSEVPAEEDLLKEYKAEKITALDLFGIEEEVKKEEVLPPGVKKLPELDPERLKKREELLRRLEENDKKAQAAAKIIPVQQQAAAKTAVFSYNEIVMMISLFDASQQIFMALLSKLIKKTPVLNMFLKTLEKAMKNNPEILKKADLNSKGSARADGSLEPARVFSNYNILQEPAEKKLFKFFAALRDVFEERLIAVEMAAGIETKDEVMSNILIQSEKLFYKKEYPKKLTHAFFEHVVPSTTLKPGE
ncbi:MAG: hypothetical protein CVV21_08405 [Candidatus Goldiibacteriota bacterium HGW-Goldbacteria-1]|nr:MAG: hypothetical protein CVV21_08405 [Candidatus Goldiibacteriota bacterium HGW-Goldbacteria-1]